MHRSPRSFRPVLGLACLACVAGAALAQPAPRGDETLVDGPPSGFYDCPAVAGRDDGRFAVLYLRGTGSGGKLMLRAGAADGTLADPFVLAVPGADYGIVESLTTTASGYSALWRQPSPPDKDPHVARSLDANASPNGVLVNLSRKGNGITVRQGGGFIASWLTNKGLNLQRLDARGVTVGRPYLVRGATSGQVVTYADGSYVAIWGTVTVEHDTDWHDHGTFARRFDRNGRSTGGVFQVVAPAPALLTSRFLAAGGADDVLAVVFEDGDSISFEHLRLSTFDRNGHRLGGPFELTPADGPESYPQAIAFDAAGNLLAVWSEMPDVYTPDAFARVFTRAAVPVGDKFHFAGAVSGATHPAILCSAASHAGDAWVISWVASTSPIDEEDSTQQVWLRRFGG